MSAPMLGICQIVLGSKLYSDHIEKSREVLLSDTCTFGSSRGSCIFLMEEYGVFQDLRIGASRSADIELENSLRLQIHLPPEGFVAGMGAEGVVNWNEIG
jgi:hypothetical protein